MTINERDVVLGMLLAVERKEAYSHRILRETLMKYQYLDKQSRSFITRLFEGTLEYQYQLDWELNHYAKLNGKSMKPVIRCILRMGVYQILYADQVPDSAACNEAVKLAEKHGFSSLKGFVNGVLRRIAREKDVLPQPDPKVEPQEYLAWKYSMPPWIVRDWTERYGRERAERMLAGALAPRPLTIRTNVRKISPGELALRLESEGVSVLPGHFGKEAMELSGLDYLGNLPSFQEGLFWVQDESSQLAVLAAGVRPGDRVLDLCAAPGGKSLLLSEYAAESGHVTARDLTPAKLALIEENAAKAGCVNLSAECHDALEPDASFVGKADVVLADLPCSGLGILGRKRDIKYRIRPEDQAELALLQRKILSVARDYVKPGGCLIYSTCTVSRPENEENVEWMKSQWEDFSPEALFDAALQEHAQDAEAAKRILAEGEKGYLQLLPGIDPCDGFFVAKFRRSCN